MFGFSGFYFSFLFLFAYICLYIKFFVLYIFFVVIIYVYRINLFVFGLLSLTFYTGHVITSYSNINETATKTKYNKNMVNPRPLFMRQRKQAIDITTNNNIINNIVMEQTMPTELTSTGAP